MNLQTTHAKSYAPTAPTKTAEAPQKAAVSAASSSLVPAWADRMNDLIPSSLVLQDASAVQGIQAKLAISYPNNLYEKEADRMAEQVVRMPDAATAPIEEQGEYKVSAAQRKVLQRQATQQTSQSTDPSIVNQVLSSGNNQPLDAETRAFMELRFGTDFSEVRVHSDGHAAESALAVKAWRIRWEAT